MRMSNSIEAAKRVVRNRNGSAAVLINLLFAALIIMAAILVAASKSTAGESYADAVFQLAGRSVLSEYDKKLFSDYGIIAFKGDELQIEKDIAFYANASLKKNKLLYFPYAPAIETTTFFDIDSDIEANLKEFSIINLEIFEEQIKTAVLKKGFKIVAGEINDNNYMIDELQEGKSPHTRTLSDEGVIESLPSSGYQDFFFLPDGEAIGIPSLADITDVASSKFIVNEYILGLFSHANDNKYSEERFYDKEIEYIIFGNRMESANYAFARETIRGIRIASNSFHISTCREKKDIIEAASKASGFISPGLPVITAAAAAIGWVAAESFNDILLLEEGKKVPFIKNDSQWSTDGVEDFFKGLLPGLIVYPDDDSGQSYRDYLRILLLLSNKEKSLVRTMDLIQINMQGTYNKDFLIRDYYAGFRFNVNAEGKKFSYLEKY